MTAHVVNLKSYKVDADGNVHDPASLTIKQMCEYQSEVRVIPNPDVANSLGSPKPEDYIVLESSSGFTLVQYFQYSIVTDDSQQEA